MTQRNPLNERYQTDERRGQTRKSAAAAKPKTRAAASVYMESSSKQKTKKGFFGRLAAQGKASEQQKNSKQKTPDRRISPDFYNPPTPEYRRTRKVWWVFIIIAIVGMLVSFMLNSWVGPSSPLTVAVLAISYVSIFIALYIDFFKSRKLRRQYQMEMSSKSKAQRRAEKQRAHEIAQKKAELEKAAQEEKEAAPQKSKGFSLFKKDNKDA